MLLNDNGIISEFRKSYIKSGIFSEELSSIIGMASDYDDMFIASKEDTEKQISDARLFYDIIRKYKDEK